MRSLAGTEHSHTRIEMLVTPSHALRGFTVVVVESCLDHLLYDLYETHRTYLYTTANSLNSNKGKKLK
jgi:hypothetical protein